MFEKVVTKELIESGAIVGKEISTKKLEEKWFIELSDGKRFYDESGLTSYGMFCNIFDYLEKRDR